MPTLPLDVHLRQMRRCHVEREDGPVPTATPPGKRYPLVYPRDTASICRAYAGMAALGAIDAEAAAAPLLGAARFLRSAQAADGCWGHRYDEDARDRSLYTQEDNVAHGVQVLARHILHARSQGRFGSEERAMVPHMARAIEHGVRRLWHPQRRLFWSTTSLHESAFESGWTLWTNAAWHEALRLALQAEGHPAWQELLLALQRGLGGLVRDEVFVRRIAPDGSIDRRPDVTLLMPGRAGFDHLHPQAAAGAAARVERELAGLGGLLRRHLPDYDDPNVHMHGGDGPYLSFSGWLAQHHARAGNAGKARHVLEQIASFARDDALPEHVAERSDFETFVQREVATGRDLAKEFAPGILREGTSAKDIVDEAARMLGAYQEALEAGDGVLRVALPHAWTHAEYALALAMVDHAPDGHEAIAWTQPA